MNLRRIVKKVLRRLGLLNTLYWLQSEVFRKTFFPIHINYKGYEFDMIGMGGDFYNSVKLYGCYEPLLIDKAIESIKPESVIFDVGCAEGYFSLFATQLNKNPDKIYGFDSSRFRGRIFEKNNKLKSNKTMHFVEAFVSDHVGGDKITLDHFVEENNVGFIDLVKIDVEGAEVMVLRGMSKCIEKQTPTLLMEIHPRSVMKMEKDGINNLSTILKDFKYDIELCPNHRGSHRGQVEPWRKVTYEEFYSHCQRILSQGGNFAINCYKNR